MIAHRARRAAASMIGILLTTLGSMDAEASSLTTGIEGSISVSPIHGGPSRLGETDSAPLAHVAFDVATDAGVVASFTTDAEGHFRVEVPPGRYTVKMHEKKKIGGCGARTVEVTAEGFAKVHWQCDTGIR